MVEKVTKMRIHLQDNWCENESTAIKKIDQLVFREEKKNHRYKPIRLVPSNSMF